MRNLKRALSLTLASVMLLGMMVLGTSAASYPDVTDEHNVEAIGVLQAVGVMSGSNNGNFNPDAKISRIEMAIVMANLLDLDVDYFQGQNTFSDVPAWANGYVNACAAHGIVTGVGGGRFGTGNVTATQAALMMLKALGYFQYNEDFNGDWARATAQQAAQIRLFEGLNVQNNTQLTRNQVAQLALNALEANMVNFNGDVGTTIPTANGTMNIGHRTSYEFRTSTESKYNTLGSDGDKSDISNQGQYYIQLGEELYDGKLTRRADTDEFQRPATTWRYDYQLVGTYVNDPDLTYTKGVDLGDIYADLGLSEKIGTDGEHYVDGKQVADVTLARKDDTTTSGSSKGVLTQVWYDDYIRNGVRTRNLVITHINTYVGKVASVSKATSSADRTITVTPYTGQGVPTVSPLNAKFETENFEAKDLITYTAAWNSSSKKYDIQTVEPLTESTTGTLTAWNGKTYGTDTGKSENNFTVAGTKYEYNANAVVVDEDAAQLSGVWSFKVNESEVNVYLDKYGYAIYVAGVEGEKNYATVIGVGGNNPYGDQTTGVTLLLPDGTKKTVTAKVKSGSTLSTQSSSAAQLVSDAIGDLVSYKIKDDNVHELTVLDNYDTTTESIGTNAKFTNGKSLLELGSANYYTNSETIFMVCTDDGSDKVYNVYIGYNNMPSFDAAGITGFALKTRNEYTNQVDIVYVSAANLAGISAVDTYFVKKKNADIYTDSTGSYYILPAIVDGEETTVKVDASIADIDDNTNDVGLWAINNVIKDKNDIITSYTKVNATVFAGTKGTSGTGTVAPDRVVMGIGASKNTASYWAYNDNTKAYYVDKDYKTISVITIGAISDDPNDQVFATIDSEKRLKDVIVVEVEEGSSAPADTYTVSVTGSTANMDYTIAVAGKPASTNKAMDVESGSSVIVTFTAKAGYVFDDGKGTRVVNLTNVTEDTAVPAPSAVAGIEKITITLELGTGVTKVEDAAGSYTSGKVFEGTKGDLLTLKPTKADGVDTIVVRFYPDNDPANPVVIAVADEKYDIPFTTSGKVTFAQDPSEEQLQELKRQESDAFGLYYEVKNAAYIWYWDNVDRDVRDRYWSTKNAYTNPTENGIAMWHNNDVEIAALSDFVNERIEAFTNAGADRKIAVTPADGWGNPVGPTKLADTDGHGTYQYTREVVVYATNANGAADTTKPVGRVTVTYNLIELENDARTPVSP